MKTFICTSEEKEAFNYLNEKIGIISKRVICYNIEIGKQKVYRQPFTAIVNGMIILKFNKIEEANELCSSINENYGDDFKVEETFLARVDG